MSERTVVKHSEQVRRAVRWISERRKEGPGVPLAKLLSEAGPLFNLSPKDQEALMLLLQDRPQRAEDASWRCGGKG